MTLVVPHSDSRKSLDCEIASWHHDHLLYTVADPHLVLPRLAELSYSPHENIQRSAAVALISLLVNHKEEPDILCMLLDYLRYFRNYQFYSVSIISAIIYLRLRFPSKLIGLH